MHRAGHSCYRSDCMKNMIVIFQDNICIFIYMMLINSRQTLEGTDKVPTNLCRGCRKYLNGQR